MPMPVRHRAERDLVDVEHLERGARADHVDDGVDAADLVEVDLLGRAAVQPALGLGERVERRRAPGRGTRSGRRASSTRPLMCAARAHDRRLRRRARGPCVAADAAAQHRLGLERPAADRQALAACARTSSRSAPASTSAPSAMSPAMPEKQWNQATVVTARRSATPSRAASAATAHGRAEAVVDADDGDARRARREHGQQRGDAFEAGAVADARRHGDDGRRVSPPTTLASAPSMPATTTTASASASSSACASSRWRPATPTSVRRSGAKPWACEDGRALVGDGQVGGAGGDDERRARDAAAAAAATPRSVPVATAPGLRRHGGADCLVGAARVSSTGPSPSGEQLGRRSRRTAPASCPAP